MSRRFDFFRRKLIQSLAFILLILCIGVQAQEEYFLTYTLEDGLSQVSVNDVLEDSKGFLWIGTQGGLNRFDGKKFEVFINQNDNANSPCGNFINCLMEDKEGKIWIGTEGEGLCYYSYQTRAFHQIELHRENSTVFSISQNEQGTVFAGLNLDGLLILPTVSPGKPPAKIWLNNIHCTSLTSSGRTFAGSDGGHVFEMIQHDGNEFRLDTLFVTPDKSAITILKERENHLWVGTRKNAYKVSLQKPGDLNTTETFFTNPTIVYDFEWNNNDELFIATGSGLYRVSDLSGIKSSASYQFNDLNPYSISNNTVYSLFMGSHDLLWVGTGKYLNLLYSNPYIFRIESSPFKKNGLNSNVVFAILKSGDALWVGTSGGGLNKIKDGCSVFFNTRNSKLPSDVVFSIAEDEGKNLWIGTKEGISILPVEQRNSPRPVFILVPHEPNNPHLPADNFIRQIFMDNRGQIWICTYNGGLYRFTGLVKERNFTFEGFESDSDTGSLYSNRVYTIFQSGNGQFWVGTDKGLNSILLDGGKYIVSRHLDVSSSPPLSSNVVYDIVEDSMANLWIGTRNGLNKYNYSRGELEKITTEDGLAGNTIYALLRDKQKNIWISTNDGISRYNSNTGLIKNYSVTDGLQGNEFNLRSKYFDPETGLMYFGGINGINYFIPDSLDKIDKETNIVLSHARYGDNLSLKDFKTIGDSIVEIKLDHDEFPLYLAFSNIDLRPARTVEFAYRFSPGNKNWIHLQDKQEIQFLHLKPGNYLLEIQGLSRGIKWKSPPLKIDISIHPPWWFTWWMKLLYVIIAIILIYFIYRYQLKQVLTKKEAQRLQELNEMKNQLYADITHELRTPLTVILGITDELKDKGSYSVESLKKQLEGIERNGYHLINLVNQMLDLSKLDKSRFLLNYSQGDVIPYLRYVFSCYEHLAEIKNTRYYFYTEIESLIMDFDPDQLFKIVGNLLSNAIKYTPAGANGEVIFHVSHGEEGSLFLKISDNGIGIGEADAGHVFDRFYRAPNSKVNEPGIGIGLALTKELTELMGGDITFKSRLNKGTSFVVELPVRNSAAVNKHAVKPEIHVPAMPQYDLPKLENIQKPGKEKILVLLVEDNVEVAMYVKGCFDGSFRVVHVKNGKEGAEKAFELIPDIVITDLMMPNKNGFELCGELKNDTKTSHVPIIMLTARYEDKDKLKGYMSGADAYIIKPFKKAELLIRVYQLLENRNKILKKFGSIFAEIPRPNTKDETFISEVVKAIHAELSNNGYKSSDLAFQMKISESQLYRKIKALTGKSTSVYIRIARLHKAKEMLVNSGITVSEAAYQTGFNDPAWFSRAFKNEFGFPPSDLKK